MALKNFRIVPMIVDHAISIRHTILLPEDRPGKLPLRPRAQAASGVPSLT